MRAEPADYVFIPLPRTLAKDLARIPERQRGDLLALSRMLRDYLTTQELAGTVHSKEAGQRSNF